MAIQDVFGDAKDTIELLFAKKNDTDDDGIVNEESDRVNIMLAGITGVGKSTLINAVFGEEFAETGIGAPVTQTLDMYEKEDVLLRIYDVKGFELDPVVQKNIRTEMKRLIKAGRKTDDKNDDIHLMWYCVSSAGSKLQPFEVDFINDMSEHIDVVIVITKSYDAEETGALRSYIEGEKDKGILHVKGIVPVLAVNRTIDGSVVKESFGLKELSDFSYEMLPDAQRRAFAASQKVSAELRRKAAYTSITLASAAAAATGAIPIPVADAAVLVPVQLTMLKGIANAYGVKFKENDFTKVVAAVAPGATTAAGKAAVGSLLKLVPGVGVAASVVSGSVAAALTVALGTAFQKALERDADNLNMDDTLSEEFIQVMKDAFDGILKEIPKEDAVKTQAS